MDRLAYTSLTGLSETAYPQRQLNNEIANASESLRSSLSA